MSKTIRKNKPKRHAKLKRDNSAKDFKKIMAESLAGNFTHGITKTGRPPLYTDPLEMQARIEEYLRSLADEETGLFVEQPTITGVCLFLGFESRQSFYDYEKKPEFSYIVKRTCMVIENVYEKRLGGTTPTGSIFALKNMGWKDTTQQQHTGANGGPIEIENRASAEAQELIDKHGPYGDEPAEPEAEAPPETATPAAEQGS